MRIGHAAFALVAKRAAPAVPLALLVVAAYGPDLVEMALRLFGSYDRELSHSLVSVGVCATALAGAYLVWRRDAGGALAVWLTWVSHWPADFLTGSKPTWPGGPTVGLDIYDHPGLDWALEIVLLIAAWLYFRRGRLSSRSAAP